MSLTAKHRERLIRLADKLEGKGPYAEVGPVPIGKFDIGIYRRKCLEPNECGFAACACGWASTDPWFRRRGMKNEWVPKPIGRFFGLMSNAEEEDPEIELPGSEVFHLFVDEAYPPYYNPRPATVAKRIRQFVEQQS